MIFWKFCIFATDSGFPKRKTFRNQKSKKFPKTENFPQERIIKNLIII